MSMRVDLLAFMLVVAVGVGYLLGRTGEPGARERVVVVREASTPEPVATPPAPSAVRLPAPPPEIEAAPEVVEVAPPELVVERLRLEREPPRLHDRPAAGATVPAVTADPSASPTTPPDLLYSRFVRREGPVLDGSRLDPKKPIPDGATIRFPAGQFVWDTRYLANQRPCPIELLVVGAGMDRTLVYVRGFQGADVCRWWVFVDLTIHCRKGFHPHGKTVTHLELVRCRLIGFDRIGIVPSRHFAVFTAVDSCFEAGFAHQTGGELFAIQGDSTLARLERCFIRGPFRDLHRADRDRTYLYRDCRFVDMPERLRAGFEKPPESVRFDNCKVEYVPTPATPADWNQYRRSVSELNPAWTDRDPR